MYEAINYNPGITGFIKAHRHPIGASLVMSRWEEEDRDWLAVYWVRRLAYNAKPISVCSFALASEDTMQAAERIYDIFLASSPPSEAISDYQRERVYRWEDDIIFLDHSEQMTRDECKQFLTLVWQSLDQDKPEPILINNPRIREPMAWPGVINLPEVNSLYIKPILLHEIAHQLKFSDKHGPEFVTTYIDLCVRFLGFERTYLINSTGIYRVLYR
jgi:hypothetical protein